MSGRQPQPRNHNEIEEPMENWKKFQGSELGSLLAGIYGGTRPKINYPKPKQSKNAPDIKESTWRAVSNKPTAVDPRKTTRRDTTGMFVPKVNGGRARSKLSLVDCIPQRRNEGSIKEEMDRVKSKITAYRPAQTHGGRNINEKDRLGQIFEFKGGKALPDELTGIVQEAPFEREARRKENLINSRYKIVNGQKVEVKHDVKRTNKTETITKSVPDYNDEMADQILSEIEERREYLNDMRGSLSQQQQDTIKMEMQTRLYELEKLDSKKKTSSSVS